MDRGTVWLYLKCDHCWLPSPQLGDRQWIFACCCWLSTNHTYFTCWNFVCQHSVMAETTVKQRAFAFISCSISEIGLSRFVYVGAIFNAVTMCRGFHLTVIAWRRSWHCCISWLHLRLFPRPFSSHAMECSGIVGEEISVCRFKSVPTWVITNRLVHAQQARLSSWRLAYPILSYPIPCWWSAGCFRCLAVNSVWDWSRI